MTYVPILFAVVVAGLAPSAKAEPLSLVLHGFSAHFNHPDNNRQWNETHPGVGLRYEHSSELATQLSFVSKNSFDRPSFYVLGEYTPLRAGWLRLGAFAGLATGYAHAVQPVGGALLRLDFADFGLALRYVPRVGSGCCSKYSTAVASVEMSLPF